MSPCYDVDGTRDYFLAIHLSLYASETIAKRILGKVEVALRDFHPTTHWGKLCANRAEFHYLHQDRYRKMDELRQMLDPQDWFIDRRSSLYEVFKGRL
jgi:hypothetical protein